MGMSKQFSPDAASSASKAAGGAAVLAALALGLAGSVALAQNEPVSASWHQHRKSFTYIGISPTYSCEGLKDALTFLLQQSGARINRTVTVSPCSIGGGGPIPVPTANLDFSTLQPGGAGDASALWRHVDFSFTRSSPQLHGSDCELVQEFKDRLLPMFTTRNITANLHCIPHQTTGNQFDLSFDVLAPADAGNHVGGAD